MNELLQKFPAAKAVYDKVYPYKVSLSYVAVFIAGMIFYAMI